MRTYIFLLTITLFAIISCSDSSTSTNEEMPPQPPETGSYQVEAAFPALSFNRPLDLQHPGGDSNRLFVVEQSGIIRVFQNDSSASEAPVFLDIQGRVNDLGNEQGLLGLAFHPNFEDNGFLYVNYTADSPNRTVISRLQVSQTDPSQADENSETEILSFGQPRSNHNGGHIRFGPDGYLYIATGDGGGGGDPDGNAQDRTNLLGNILRIDVDASGGETNYAIPADNPFAGNSEGFREEIFAYGLRNPFRFSFDTENGDLWVGDVGQNRFEEIDLVQNGDNLGWNITEGNSCFEPMQDCDREGLTDPVLDYSQNGSQSVTGGFVYRGSSLEELTGHYVYADFISGRVWALDASKPGNPNNIELLDSDLAISGFGEDAENELYITAFDGMIYRIARGE
jgi:glucose/arabinose dehydrogenase